MGAGDWGRKAMGLLWSAAKNLGVCAGIFCTPLAFGDLVGRPMHICGNSMDPTLRGNDARWWKRDFVWMSRLFREPHVNEIFVFTSPLNPAQTHIKRIAHREGEWFISRQAGGWVQVPDNHYWMVSDIGNPKVALDSNVYGPVNRGLLKGRATRIIWPPARWKKL